MQNKWGKSFTLRDSGSLSVCWIRRKQAVIPSLYTSTILTRFIAVTLTIFRSHLNYQNSFCVATNKFLRNERARESLTIQLLKGVRASSSTRKFSFFTRWLLVLKSRRMTLTGCIMRQMKISHWTNLTRG